MLQHIRVIWAFWFACGIAAAGGLAPLALGGTSSRVTGVIIPFAVAAIALGACALLYGQGRPVAAGLYFIAGLAIVYGILGMLSVPLRLAVIGTCPPGPASCPVGFERPMTAGESAGLGFAVGMGIVAVLTGFFGLVTLYRQSARRVEPSTPPVRRIAPVATAPPVATAHDTTATTEAPVPTPAPSPAPAAVAQTPELELAAPEPELELPAHTEALELPAPGEPATQPVEQRPAPGPRRRRTPKVAKPGPPPGSA